MRLEVMVAVDTLQRVDGLHAAVTRMQRAADDLRMQASVEEARLLDVFAQLTAAERTLVLAARDARVVGADARTSSPPGDGLPPQVAALLRDCTLHAPEPEPFTHAGPRRGPRRGGCWRCSNAPPEVDGYCHACRQFLALQHPEVTPR